MLFKYRKCFFTFCWIFCNIKCTVARPQIVLNYKPLKPSYVGASGTNLVGQIVPPGEPWPDSPAGYVNFSVLNQRPVTARPPNLVDRLPEITTNTPTNRPPDIPRPDRPTFVGPSGTNLVGQLIPTGKPWPDSPERYQNFSVLQNKPTLTDRLPEISTQEPSPNRPSFVGPSGTNIVGQLIPPGKPWPDSQQGYQNFSVLPQRPPATSLADRFPDITTTRRPNIPSFVGPSGTQLVGQIIPPGNPWPNSPEGYQNFSVLTQRPITKTTLETTTESKQSTTISDLLISTEVAKNETASVTWPQELVTTTGATLFTSAIKFVPNEDKPRPTEDYKIDAIKNTSEEIPVKSEIPQTNSKEHLNNLDFFNPQFLPNKPPEIFTKPDGLKEPNKAVSTSDSNAKVNNTDIQFSVSSLLPSEALDILDRVAANKTNKVSTTRKPSRRVNPSLDSSKKRQNINFQLEKLDNDNFEVVNYFVPEYNDFRKRRVQPEREVLIQQTNYNTYNPFEWSPNDFSLPRRDPYW